MVVDSGEYPNLAKELKSGTFKVVKVVKNSLPYSGGAFVTINVGGKEKTYYANALMKNK